MPTTRSSSVFVVASLVVAGPAHATQLTASGAVVRLTTDASAVAECEPKGEVRATPPYVLPDDWKIQLRNKGGDLGADVVLHEKPGLGNVPGTAWLCPVVAPVAGCGKDTDCKGDRICVAGACTDP